MRRFTVLTGLFAFSLAAALARRRGAQTGRSRVPSRGLGTWSEKARLPDIRSEAAHAFVNGKLYVMGGLARMQEASMLVQEWDAATDPWRDKAPMPGPLSHPSARSSTERSTSSAGSCCRCTPSHSPPRTSTIPPPTGGAPWRR